MPIASFTQGSVKTIGLGAQHHPAVLELALEIELIRYLIRHLPRHGQQVRLACQKVSRLGRIAQVRSQFWEGCLELMKCSLKLRRRDVRAWRLRKLPIQRIDQVRHEVGRSRDTRNRVARTEVERPRILEPPRERGLGQAPERDNLYRNLPALKSMLHRNALKV